jgi:hypothetical protein
MQATKEQKKLIQINAPTRDIKGEFVQWATEDVKKISCNDLTFEQANKILVKLGQQPHKLHFRAGFDKKNSRHKYILSLCVQFGWWQLNDKHGRVADLEKLNDWMHSAKCPVQKALKK